MDESLSEAIGAVLETAVADGAVPGAVAVVVDGDGTRAIAAGGSTRSDGAGVPLQPDARFRMASMTKALASVAALQLVERGKLGLDDEVGSILPAWNDLQVLDGWDGDEPRLRAPKTKATIRHLLTHTAGHGYCFVSPELTKYHEVTGTPERVQRSAGTSLATPLQSDPGTRWEYGINTDWLGLVVEEVSGQSLDDYLDGASLHPTRHERHQLRRECRRSGGDDAGARTHRGRRPRRHRDRPRGRPGVDGRRPRLVLDGRGLRALPLDAAARRHRAGRHPGARGGHRRPRLLRPARRGAVPGSDRDAPRPS